MIPQTYLYRSRGLKGITIDCKKQRNAIKRNSWYPCIKIDTNKITHVLFKGKKKKTKTNIHLDPCGCWTLCMFTKTLHHFLPIHIQIVWQTTFIILKNELQNDELLNYGAITTTFKEQTSYLMLKTCCKLVYSWPLFFPLHSWTSF